MASNNNLAAQYPSTLIANSYYQSGNPGGKSTRYFCLSGTSMATPVVSGAAALLIQKSPALSPDQVKARLMKTAYKAFPQYSSAVDSVYHGFYSNISDIFTVGAGQVNIGAALNNTDLANVPAISPMAVMNTLNGQVTLVFAENIVWGTNIVWGANIVWGSNIVWGANIVWGSTVVSGQNMLGFSMPWEGTGAPWISATNIVWGTVGGLSSSSQAFAADDGDQ